MRITPRLSIQHHLYRLLGLVLLGLVTACDNPTSATPPEPKKQIVSLSLGQFPSDRSSYHIYADFWKETTFLVEADLGLTDPAGVGSTNFALPLGTTKFGIYLFDPKDLNNDPLYFDFFTVKPSDTAFGSYYWLDYAGYFNRTPRSIRYGISDEAARPIADLSALSLDFSKAPYFLYKHSNASGNIISAKFSSVGDTVWAWFGSSISAIIQAQTSSWSTTYLKSGTIKTDTTPFYLIAQPKGFETPTTASIAFSEVSRATISDTVSCLVPTEKPSVVYAVTKNSHSLYLVDPMAKTASLIAQLPLQDIKEVVYSSADKKLYGFTSNSGTLLIYDLTDNTSKTVVYAQATEGTGIAISPTERRIYLSAGASSYRRKLYILDQDSLALVASGALSSSDGDLAYSPSEKAIFYSGMYEIKKYSVANDVIVDSGTSYSSTAYYGDNGFVVNNAGTQLVYANIGTGYFVRTIDTKTMQVAGTWTLGAYPRRSLYSSDDRFIFASNGDGNVYKAPTSDFSQVTSYLFPPTFFVVNSDSSRVVGFLDSDKSFYFADVSASTPSANLSSGSWSSLRSRARSVGALQDFLRHPQH